MLQSPPLLSISCRIIQNTSARRANESGDIDARSVAICYSFKISTEPYTRISFQAFSHLTDSSEKMEKMEKVLGPASTQLMSALNGYAEKSQDVLGQVLSKTVPKAQILKEKTMAGRQFPLSGKSSLIKHSQAGGAQMMPRMTAGNQRKAMDRQQGKENAEKASQQK